MEPEKKSLGTELRDVRQMRKLSLREVEGATGISNAYLSQLENDKITKPSPHFLYKLARLFDISYELLMETAGYISGNKDSSGPKSLRGAALFTDDKLTREEEEKLAEYLQFLRRNSK